MDPALEKRLDGVAMLLFFILLSVAYQAADVLGLVLGFVLGATVLVFSTATENHPSTTND